MPYREIFDTVNNVCNSCSPVQNATFTTANSCAFKCNTGYVKKNNKCEVKIDDLPYREIFEKQCMQLLFSCSKCHLHDSQ